MSQPWKLLPVAAIVAALALVSSGVFLGDNSADAEIGTIDIGTIAAGNDSPAEVQIQAEDDRGTIEVEISGGDDIDVDDVSCNGCVPADLLLLVDGFQVLSDDVDDDGVIDDLTITFTFTIDCDAGDDIAISVNDDEDGDIETVECQAAGSPTPTPTTTGTVTTTVGPAATVTTNASPASVSCSGTSIVTIQVRDASGDPVASGTPVVIAASMGSVSPSSGQTTDASGSAFVFFTAPANQGGTATITATSGSASGQTTVAVNCGASATATTAPPPTVSPGGGVITPPSTGNAGLAEEGNGWAAVMVSFLVIATLGALAIVRVRG
jgi:hypothetical protein